MKRKTYVMLATTVLALIIISVLLYNRLIKVTVDFTVGNETYKGIQQIRISSGDMRNGIWVNDKNTLEDFASHFKTVAFEKSGVNKIESPDLLLMLSYENDGDVGKVIGLAISKDTMQIGGIFYKCNPELYDFLMDEHSRLMKERGLSLNN